MMRALLNMVHHTFGSLKSPTKASFDQAGQTRDRLITVICGVVLVFAVVQARLIAIGFSENKGPARVAQLDRNLAASRPKILDREGKTLALDIEVQSLFAVPKSIDRPQEILDALLTVLPDLPKEKTLAGLSSDRAFQWLKREITPKQQADIIALGLPGIHFRPEIKRFYPHGATASHVVGHANLDNKGNAGLESHIDKTGLRDLHSAGFAMREDLPPVRTTLDLRVQHFVRHTLQSAMERYRAIAAAGVVLDAKTGEIIALSSLPDYDPNDPKTRAVEGRFNRMTAGVFEMGSTFKLFTTAMALDSGLVTLNSRFDARKPIYIGRHRIGDFHAKNRVLSVPEVFIYSSNIGTAKMAEAVGVDGHRAFMEKMGLLSPISGLELPEIRKPTGPKRWRQIHSTTISFGHGMSTTPLQTAMAAAAVLNGGWLMQPTLLPRSEGKALLSAKRVLRPETSDAMRYLMRLNVLKGSGRRAAVPGFLVGGKTGTAEKVVNKRYSKKHRFNSFLAAFPINDPRYVVLVIIDEPKPEEGKKAATAGLNAAPMVREIIERAAPVLGVAPDFRVRDTTILSSYTR
ncbi:MAG: penicillin-binding protein 2 [Pseudomonadota bacterium]